MNPLKILTALLAGLLLLATIAAANELVIKNVELEDDEVAPGAMLEVTFDLETPADKDYKYVVVTAQVKGDDDTKITRDFGTIFAGSKREERKITVNVPEDLRDGAYKVVLKAKGVLKVVGTRTSTLEVPFTVEQQYFSVFVDEVELSDENLLAGTSFDVAVKIANNDNEDLENVKVQVEIPELKAKQSVVLRELAQDNEQTVYLSLGVPQAAESGLYPLKVTASNAKTQAVATQNIEVTKVAAPAVVVDNQKVVPTQVTTPSIKVGQGAVVSLEVRNNQDAARTFDVVLGGVADWTSNARIDPASVTLDAGESAAVQVYLLPKTAGERAFTLYVKDGATLVSATQVNVKVAGSAMPVASGAQQFDKNWAFAVAVVILGILGAVLSRNRNDGQKKLGAIYY